MITDSNCWEAEAPEDSSDTGHFLSGAGGCGPTALARTCRRFYICFVSVKHFITGK